MTDLKKDTDSFIFRPIKTDKRKRQSLRPKNKPISYSTIRDEFKEVLKETQFDQTKFCLHSLRAGGASAAANLGVSDRLIKKHGRWKSENIKDRYISENINNLLTVSKNLGL